MDSTEEPLERLARAFGTEPSPDAVADAIIARSRKDPPQLTYGQNERGSVVGIISLLVDHEGALAALEDHDSLPPDTFEAMQQQVHAHPPETIEPDAFVGIVMSQIRAVL